MVAHDVVIITYKSGKSCRGWVSACDESAKDAEIMIEGRENHAINILNVHSVAITRQFF
jgi:hypothetical protein